jgi:hypothetical protein
MPSFVYVDDGVREYYVDEDEDWFHMCEMCNDIFETTRPLPSEEARLCAYCHFNAIEVIQKWWRNRLHNKKAIGLN